MDIEEHGVPIYAGWADSAISIAIIMCLPLVSQCHGLGDYALISACSTYPPFPPSISSRVITLLLSGGIASIIGFCTSPWQLVALRVLTGVIHFGGFMSVIELGEIVDKESRNEGEW
jgi:hypothetical protein